MVDSIAHMAEAELGGPASVLVRQRRDHIELDRLLGEIGRSDRVEQQEELLSSVCRLVFPHAFAEEAVLWPLIRRRLPAGAHLTLEIEREHQEINELFTQLETMAADEERRDELMNRIFDLLRQDVRDEEDRLLPMLREAMTDAELVRAGRVWGAVRRVAPTRPHPFVARRPPGNAAAAVPLTIIDRSRDRIDRLARHAPERMAGAARAVSSALARAAGAIEHVPPLPFGETADTHQQRNKKV